MNRNKLTVLIHLLFLVLLDTSQADDVGVYWGQSSDEEEGTLEETCATGKYSYVNIAYLEIYDITIPPEINLGSHCDGYGNGCTNISSYIRNCQQKHGIKVMLSVKIVNGFKGSSAMGYLEKNKLPPKHLSKYLWDNFFGGNSSSRPLGDAVLDGIDFAVTSDSLSYWKDVASYLKTKSSSKQKIYLSASPLCSFDNSKNSIFSSGLFDYLWLQFVESPQCQYKEGNVHNLIKSWNQWTKLNVGKIFLGLPASLDTGLSNYIPADVLISQILPNISKSSNYGGVMLWSRYFDRRSRYSDSIISPLCKQQNSPQCSLSDIYFMEILGYMSMAGFRINQTEEISHQCCEVICRNNCSCVAYAPTNYTTRTGCQIWSIQPNVPKHTWIKRNIYVANKGRRKYTPESPAPTKPPESLESLDKRSKHHAVILMCIITAVGALATVICYLSCASWSKYKTKVDTKKEQKKLIHDIGGDAMVSMINSRAKKIKTQAKTNDEFEIFSFESIEAATNNFSSSNKLGEGGFGQVYMGRLTNDQEIAIKRLSRSSEQGLIEFKNEAKLIAKLQHTNLVKLLGLCIEREERMLVYECMPNRSLNFHLFDSKRKKVLNWEKRLNIIEGIAQGILYLHKYSNIKVIHRDLKASNILLDDKMNPKISDFGTARIFGLKGSEEKTKRIVGTYGYMSPEYLLNGVVSIKTDVFSFGVLLLEIVSGKKNYCYYHSDVPVNLIGHAWQLWNDGRALELMDPELNETCTPNEVLRCMHIGLLCVQDRASDRPTMFDVVSFLSNHTIQLAHPKQPAFFINVDRNKLELPANKQETYSINYVTVSVVDGR